MPFAMANQSLATVGKFRTKDLTLPRRSMPWHALACPGQRQGSCAGLSCSGRQPRLRLSVSRRTGEASLPPGSKGANFMPEGP